MIQLNLRCGRERMSVVPMTMVYAQLLILCGLVRVWRKKRGLKKLMSRVTVIRISGCRVSMKRLFFLGQQKTN